MRNGCRPQIRMWVIHAAVPEVESWDSRLEHLRRNWRETPIQDRTSLPKYGRFATAGCRWTEIEMDTTNGWAETAVLQLHHNNVFTLTVEAQGEQIKGREHGTDRFFGGCTENLLRAMYAAGLRSDLRQYIQRGVEYLPLAYSDAPGDVVRNFVVVFVRCTTLDFLEPGVGWWWEVDPQKAGAALSLLLQPMLYATAGGWPSPDDQKRVYHERWFGKNLHLFLGSRALVAVTSREGISSDDDSERWENTVQWSLLDYAEDLLAWHTGLIYGLAKIDEVIRSLAGPKPDFDAAERLLYLLPSLMWSPGLYEDHSITAKGLQFQTLDKVFGFRYLEQTLRDKLNVLQNALLISKLDAVRLLLTRGTGSR